MYKRFSMKQIEIFFSKKNIKTKCDDKWHNILMASKMKHLYLYTVNNTSIKF